LRALQILLDASGRLGLVVALLFLVEDPKASAVVAALATLFTAARFAVRGVVMERETRAAWTSVLGALRSKDVRALETLRQDQAGATLVFDAIREAAVHRAGTLPDLAAAAVIVLGLVVLLVVRVSLWWLALGAGCAVVLVVVLLPAMRRQRRAQLRGFATIGPLARDFQALIGAAPELRASGTEPSFTAAVRTLVAEQANAEREALRHGALYAAVPALLAVVAFLIPRAAVERLGASGRIFDLGVLAAALLPSLLGLVRSVESSRQARPYLEVLERFDAPSAEGARTDAKPDVSTVSFDDVTVIHPDGHAAPRDLTFRLERGGLAIVGPNGSGKSTAVRLVLGLSSPTSGSVSLGDTPVTGAVASDRVAYLPQRPYVDGGESLAFHLKLAGIEPDAPWVEPALRRAGLWPALARRRVEAPLAIPMGSLSGGEAQRFFIARTLGRPAALTLLDEPEVGLDAAARADLRAWLEEAADAGQVILVAHDETIVPPSFRVVRLGEPADRSAQMTGAASEPMSAT
jgi:ABC-type transport system involved in cytochrome bd biosynthesis fused ATPase/permease subunit